MSQQPQQAVVAVYINQMHLRHGEHEFVMDFFQALGEGGLIRIAKLCTSPGHAKKMMRAFKESIRQYELRFGVIPEVDEEKPN